MEPHELARAEAEAFAAQGALFRPLAASATDPDNSPGVPTGLTEIDNTLGGGYRTGLHLVVGFSHNGKTQVLFRTIWENRHQPMILFSPDETSEMVIAKLLSMVTGEHVDEVFWWSASKKAGAINEHYPMLAVNDAFLSGPDMIQLIQEAEQVWQQRPVFAAYDYLEMFGSARGQDALGALRSKARRFKEMVKDTQLPWLVLHQLNRGGSKGRPVTMTDLSFGGEQEAITITGCWRKVFGNDMTDAERRAEENGRPTINVSIIKNKQRPGLLPEGVQYTIEATSGLIRPMRPGEKIMTGMRDMGGVL